MSIITTAVLLNNVLVVLLQSALACLVFMLSCTDYLVGHAWVGPRSVRQWHCSIALDCGQGLYAQQYTGARKAECIPAKQKAVAC